jgi:hypothetical protein
MILFKNKHVISKLFFTLTHYLFSTKKQTIKQRKRSKPNKLFNPSPYPLLFFEQQLSLQITQPSTFPKEHTIDAAQSDEKSSSAG